MAEWFGDWGDLSVEIQNDGWWKIDKQRGLTLVWLKLNRGEVCLANAPTLDEVVCIVDALLQAEYKNDNFVFTNGVFGKNSKRPAQLLSTINRIDEVTKKWKQLVEVRGEGGQPEPEKEEGE